MGAKYCYSLSNINNLADDVLGEIFIRLSFISSGRCKCVCKRWLGVISSPCFTTQVVSRQHTLFNTFFTFLSPHQLMLAFLPSDFDFNSQIQMPSPDILVKGNVCGYSNGLFLCCSNRYTSGRGYFVYDPFTKECTYIHPFPEANKKQSVYAVGFLSETLNSTRYFWIVIVNSFIRKTHAFKIEVFFSKGTWRQFFMSCANGFAFAPHWMLSLAYQGNLYFMGMTNIFVFDPVFLGHYTIDYPEGADAMNIMSFGFLGCSNGTLRIADIGHNDLRVWELIWQEEGVDPINFVQRWHLVHRTNLSTHLPVKFCANYFKRVGGFHPYDGNIVYLHSYADGLFAANLLTNKFVSIPGYDKYDISPFQLQFPLPPKEDIRNTKS
ncbi:F-box protein, partial [Mucuna pruriens]